jgi:transposase
MVVADGQGLPVGGALESASPAEVRLAPEAIINASERLGRWPSRLIADKAYDADWLRHVLEMVGGELMCPHRRERKREPIQDGRKLRRYRKRWKVERLFAWLGNWRRLLIRHERLLEVYSGFFKIACLMILIRHF